MNKPGQELAQVVLCYFCEIVAIKSKNWRTLFSKELRKYYFCRELGIFSLYLKLQDSGFKTLHSISYIENVSHNDQIHAKFNQFQSLKKFLRNISDPSVRKFIDYGCVSSKSN